MKTLKWILIALALITVIILTVPSDISPKCNHVYDYSGCPSVVHCELCGHKYTTGSRLHSGRTETQDGCSIITSCSDCGEWISTRTYHSWVSDNCEQGLHCSSCGEASASSWHARAHSLFGVFTYCSRCYTLISTQIPTARDIIAFLGFLMCATGAVFIIIKHKDIKVQGGKYIRTVTPESYTRDRDIHVENL